MKTFSAPARLCCFQIASLGQLPVIPSHWISHVTRHKKIRDYQIWWCQRLCDWTVPPSPLPRIPAIEYSMNNVVVVVVRWCFILHNNFHFTFFPLLKNELLRYVKINVYSDCGPSKHSTPLLWSWPHCTTVFDAGTHTLPLAQTSWVTFHSGSFQCV